MTSLFLLLLTACGDKADEDTSSENVQDAATEQTETPEEGEDSPAGEDQQVIKTKTQTLPLKCVLARA